MSDSIMHYLTPDDAIKMVRSRRFRRFWISTEARQVLAADHSSYYPAPISIPVTRPQALRFVGELADWIKRSMERHPDRGDRLIQIHQTGDHTLFLS